MAVSVGAITGSRRGRRRSRRAALSEINVTPMVDVMLVLLIIFMVSAPLLQVGVPVELPRTEAGSVDSQTEPLTISIQKDGSLFIQDTSVTFEGLSARLTALAGDQFDKPIFVRADGAAPYSIVAQVMARLSATGFTAINLITDTAGAQPPTGRAPAADAAPPGT